MEIRVLFNHKAVDSRFAAGFGWACLINRAILFDAGSNPDVLRHNFKQAGASIEDVTDIVLSHEHWDHVDGLGAVLSPGCGRRVYIPSCFSHDIRKSIQSMGGELIVSDESSEIAEGIMYSRAFDFEYKGRLMCERMLTARAASGLVVVVGCSHPGIINMLNEAAQNFPDEKICAVIGGMHLRESSPGEIGSICVRFQLMGVRSPAPTHCSGDLAEDLFAKQYGKQCLNAAAGAVLRF